MSVLVCLSVVINTLKLWEERVYFYLHCQVSLSLRELWAGIQAGIQDETMEESCSLAHSYPMFTRLSYMVQSHLFGDRAVHSRLGLPFTLVIIQDNLSQEWP